MTICNEPDCQRPAAYTITYPGEPPQSICKAHRDGWAQLRKAAIEIPDVVTRRFGKGFCERLSGCEIREGVTG